LLHKIKQLLNYYTYTYSKDDDKYAIKYLNHEEYFIFSQMDDYDKKHSVNIVKEIINNPFHKDNKLLVKFALLHDIGKIYSYNLMKRIKHSITKNYFHAKKGYEIMENINSDVAKLILEHHNKYTYNEIILYFQKLDDKF